MASAGAKPCSQSPQWNTSPQSAAEPGERIGGEDRGVAVARADIPPVAADRLDVGRLQRLGEHDAAAGGEEAAMSWRQARGETVCSITSKQVIRLNCPSGRAGLENGS